MINESLIKEIIKNPKKVENLKYDQILSIFETVKEILIDENFLLEFDIEDINEEIYVIGDIHGNLKSLLKFIELINQNNPKYVVFLGDIVDRGPRQLECLVIVLSLKILYSNKYFILKGNHETLEMNEYYGFFQDFTQRFNDPNKFKAILDVYNALPISALVNNSILLMHGGIPRDIDILEKIRGLKTKNIISVFKSITHGIVEIMWNDPKSGLKGFSESFRGPGIYFFGEDVFEKFMEANKLKYLVRAHECFPEGYRWFFNNRLLSIFSSANYRGDFFPSPASFAVIKNNKVIPKIL